ncbi:hypothetical protein AAE478_005665 [Parahypoxylon ruwenzoriense]
MAASDLPSFQALRDSGQVVFSSMDMLRVRWKPFGPLSTSIQVVDDPADPASPQKPYQTDPGSFHSISTSAATEPPVSSITVTQGDLDQWESDWVEEHVPHADDYSDDAVWVAAPRGDDVEGEGEGEEEEDGGDAGGRKLMRCCDEDRPHAPPPLVVRASTQPFVTIHDFVTTVHDWLQTVRDDILSAKGVTQGGPLPADTPLYVSPVGLDRLRLREGRNQPPDFEDMWKGVAEHIQRRVNGTLIR